MEYLKKIMILTAFAAAFLALGSPEPASAIPSYLDTESQNCLSCHDASVATDVTLQVCSEPDCDHPIGVNYVWASSQNPGLRAPILLNPNIRLVDGGSIGCGTCHVPYNSADHSALSTQRAQYPDIPDPMLVIDNRRSELCLACHIK